MARIQTYENNTSISAGGVTRYPTDDPVGRALQGFGNSVANVGIGILDEQKKLNAKAEAEAKNADNVRLQAALNDHEDRVRQFALDQAPNYTGDGTDGAGYTKAVADFATKDANETIKGNFSNRTDASVLPDRFRMAARGVLGEVNKTEFDTALKFQGATTDKLVAGLSTKVAERPDDQENYDASVKEFVDYATSTNIDRPNLQARITSLGLAKLQRSRLEAYAALHPDEFKKASAGVFVGAPAPDTPQVEADIINSANDAGVDPRTMLAIGRLESGLDPNAKNATSSAVGTFQVLNRPDTLAELGITADQRTDTKVVSAAAASFISRQTDIMKSKNIPVTPGKQYMTWQMGPGVALATMQADPSTPMSDVVNRVLANRSPAYRAKFMAANPAYYGPNVTAGQVIATFERKVSSAYDSTSSAVTSSTATADEDAHKFFEKLFPGGAPQLSAKDLGEVQVLAARKSAEASREQQDMTLGYNVVTGAIRPDPRDDKVQKAVNEYVVKNNFAAGIAQGDAGAHQLAAKITSNAGFMPEAFVNGYSTAMAGSDAKGKSSAYAALADLQAQNPAAWDATKMAGDDKKRVDEYVALTTVSNLSPDDAVKRIDFERSPEGRKQAEAQKAGLVTSRDAEIKELSEDDVVKHFDAPWSWSKPTDAEGKFIAAATDAYKSQYLFNREQGRSPEDSKAIALSSLDKNWGASYVADTGKGANSQTFMPYPPEKSYKPTDVGYEWITDQARNQAAAFVADRYPKLTAAYVPERNLGGRTPSYVQSPDKPSEIKDALGVKLIPDLQTAHEARAGLPRTYLLMVRLPNGTTDISRQRFVPDQLQADREAADRFHSGNKRTTGADNKYFGFTPVQ